MVCIFFEENMKVLELYQNDFGQLLNVNKSGYLVHPWISIARQGVIKRVTKFSRKDFSVHYLGSPLFIGRCKGAYHADLCQNIVDEVLSWKSRLLSPGGKIILIKHVLLSIPTHLLASGVVLKGIFHFIEDVHANFLWGAAQDLNQFHWIRWKDLCYPREEGGVGFRSIYETYVAFLNKLWGNLGVVFLCWSYSCVLSIVMEFILIKLAFLLQVLQHGNICWTLGGLQNYLYSGNSIVQAVIFGMIIE